MSPKRTDSADEILKDSTGDIDKLRKMGIAIITYMVRVQEGQSQEPALRAGLAIRSPQTGPARAKAGWARLTPFWLLAFMICSLGSSLARADDATYYFPHLAFGGGFQATLTYVNYSPQGVVCRTTFYSDSGASLLVPFATEVLSNRFDGLAPGADLHVQTQALLSDALVTGWAQAQCTGPVKASLLYRLYDSQGAPQGEASVNAMTAPATEFVTFAETQTGVAFANPSPAPATVTLTALDANGVSLASTSVLLAPNAHNAAGIGGLLGLKSFTGSVQITSPIPIVSLSLNAEAFTAANPVFSSLPPGDLPDATPLAAGTGGGIAATGAYTNAYFFPHLAFGGGFQNTLTYVNYSPQSVSCLTTFYSDSGTPLPVPFATGNVSTRIDYLARGGTLHEQTLAGLTDASMTGWAAVQCTGPVKAGLLYRRYDTQGIAQAEAAVNAMPLPVTEFVTFAETQTGVALANPSPIWPATVTITALDKTGVSLGTTTVQLPLNAHRAANIGPLLGLKNFTGSVQITSPVPILCLSLNAEAFTSATPVFSSLPPGDLPAFTPLATGH